MKRDLGVAYCGLACCICGENENCLGCRNDGCKDKEWCKNFKCCKEKGLNGCWECSEFPCTGGMLDKIRIRAIASFIKQYGEEELMQCLERNKKSGIIYHYEGQLVGDYDKPQTEAEIIHMIKHGYEQKYIDYVHEYLVLHNGEKSTNKGQGFRSRASHCERVYNLAKELSVDEPRIHRNALYIAAIFHDIGYCSDRDNNDHAKRSAKLFRQYAITNELDITLTDEIYSIISLHSNKELLKNNDTPLELIILMEADLLDEEGAMGIVFDCMTQGALNPSCYEDGYNHIKKYSAGILELHPMVTDKAKEYWAKKQKVIYDFMELLKRELFIEN